MKKILVILLACARCYTVLAGCGGGSSEPAADESAEPITIKIAHTDSSSRSTNTWAEWLGEYLEENAPGRFNVEVYSDGQLGDTTDVIAGLGLGTGEMVFDLVSCFTEVAGDESACTDIP